MNKEFRDALCRELFEVLSTYAGWMSEEEYQRLGKKIREMFKEKVRKCEIVGR